MCKSTLCAHNYQNNLVIYKSNPKILLLGLTYINFEHDKMYCENHS